MALKWIKTLATAASLAVIATVSHGEHTGPLVTPTAYPGNFVAADSTEVCWALFERNLITLPADFTGDLLGIKVDPPMNFLNDYLSVEISADGKFLSWESEGAKVLAVIVKGGPNFNLYNYLGYYGLSNPAYPDHDNGLRSPLQGRNIPQISHYNICYVPTPVEGGDEGCTPGYWRNHTDRWIGAAPTDDFDTTFGVDAFAPDITLGQAIAMGGGGVQALARHATAALLNAYGGVPNADGTTVGYPMTPAQVIAAVQAAVDGGDIEATKDMFAGYNELGCPLSGTPATK